MSVLATGLLIGPAASKPRRRTLLVAWAAATLTASLTAWFADVAFYDRFRVFTTDLPSWSPWSALELTVQFFGYLVVGALWLWWPRRHVVVAMAAIALAVGGMGARAWAHHEADRAWGGTAVRPAAVLPFSFSASPVRMIPHGSSTLPEGVPSHGLGLRFSQDVTVVFDPNTHETVWVGSAMAVPARILR